MKHALGFIIPDGCKKPASCRPDNPTYHRRRHLQPCQAGEEVNSIGYWNCSVCSNTVHPQPKDGTEEPTAEELAYVAALVSRFDKPEEGQLPLKSETALKPQPPAKRISTRPKPGQ